MKKSFAQILQGLDDSVVRKLAAKLPEWADRGIEIPAAINLEQCSSSVTARYKAALVAGVGGLVCSAVPMGSAGGVRVADDLQGAAGGTCVSDGLPGVAGGVRVADALHGSVRVVDGLHAAAGSVRVASGFSDGGAELIGELPVAGVSVAHGVPGSARVADALHVASGSVRVADLTGGLGVDSWAFSQVVGRVLYNERVGALAAAVERNFERLEVDNVEFFSLDAVSPDGYLSWEMRRVLEDFRPDVIYADPARRDGVGRKVFRLEDCSPDILKLLPELMGLSRFVLVKLSPMADISLVIKQLSEVCVAELGVPCVREVHVVGASGECKELLVLIERGFASEPVFVAWTGGSQLRFTAREEAAARSGGASLARVCPSGSGTGTGTGSGTGFGSGTGSAGLCTGAGSGGVDVLAGSLVAGASGSGDGGLGSGASSLVAGASVLGDRGLGSGASSLVTGASDSLDGGLGSGASSLVAGSLGSGDKKSENCRSIGALRLFEPSPVLMKAACLNLVSVRWGLRRLAPSTHLFLCGNDADFMSMAEFGKLFDIIAVEPLNKVSLKDVRKRWPSAGVSARNIPMSSEELAHRLGVRDGGDVHIFGCSVDHEFVSEFSSGRVLLVCRRVA